MDVGFTRREEMAHALTHGLGIALSVAAGVFLIVRAAAHGDVWRLVGVAMFSATLVLLYTASTLYHGARSEVLKRRLRLFDHSAIYLLIAGTYTPFALGPLRGGWGWTIFGVAWGLAVAGVVFKLLWIGRFPRLSTALYLAMGWLVLVAVEPMLRTLSVETLLWLAAGGLAYTGGTAFYHSRRIPYGHAIWHLFVLAGSLCHVAAVATL